MKVSIANLRKLGGVWTSHRIGFGNYRYEGKIADHTFEVYKRSHLAPKFDGDEDTTVSRWHIKIDGSDYWYSSGFDPVDDIKEWLEENDEV